MESIATVAGLVQGYGRSPVITDLNLRITAGVLGLLGPNGAGKTTLLRTLATVTPPLQGKLKICGAPVRTEAEARTARRSIGYLPQEFGYFPGFTVYDFVRYCAWLRDIPDRETHAATVKALDLVQLADRKDSKLKTLSGGMIRRCGIASAIVGSPQLLLLDEPTVGLDPAQRLEFRELIRSLPDVAVVVSTHLVEDVAAICDDVRVMAAGRFVFKGSPQSLADAAIVGAAGDTALERGYMTVLARQGAMA